MRTECLQHKYVYESPVAVQRLVVTVADKCQGCTQSASGRPFGVGLLVAGVDQTGPHIYYNCPSGNYYEYKAMTIGARSQVCVRVYLCVVMRLMKERDGKWRDRKLSKHKERSRPLVFSPSPLASKPNMS